MIKNTNNLYRNLIEHLPVSLVNDKGLKLTHCPFMSCRIMVAVPGPNALSCVLYNDKCTRTVYVLTSPIGLKVTSGKEIESKCCSMWCVVCVCMYVYCVCVCVWGGGVCVCVCGTENKKRKFWLFCVSTFWGANSL